MRNVLRNRWRRDVRILVLSVVAVALVGCEEKNAYVPPPPPKVTVAKPVKNPFTEYLEVTGNTAATETVELRARIKGFLEAVHFEDGDLMNKGDLLFEIDPKEYEAAVARAKAAVSKAKAEIPRTEKNLARARALFKRGNISEQSVDARISQRDQAKAQVEENEAALRTAEINLGYTRVVAPFSGRMSRRLVDPGNLVGENTNTHLATIVRTDPIYAYFTVNERDLLRIRSKNQAENLPSGKKAFRPKPVALALANEEGFPHPGQLDYADPVLDATTGTIEARATFPNPKHIMLPGMFVRLRAPIKQGTVALMVPVRAVGNDQSGPYVLVVTTDNTVARRSVVPGSTVKGMRVIEKGLKGDEQVVVKGLLRAIPGRKVTPETEQASAQNK